MDKLRVKVLQAKQSFKNHIPKKNKPLHAGNNDNSSHATSSPTSVGDCSKQPSRPVRPSFSNAQLKFPHAIVKHDFTAVESDELSAHQNELVALLRRVDENWYAACSLDRKRKGFIPCNFLDVQVDVKDHGDLSLLCDAPVRPKQKSATDDDENPYSSMANDCVYSSVKSRPASPSVSSSTQDTVAESEAPGESEPTPEDYANLSEADDSKESSGRTTPQPRVSTPDKEEVPLYNGSDAIFRVIQDFESIVSGDLNAKEGELAIWLDEGAKKWKPLPNDWIECMNLSGVKGTFPGNLGRSLSSDKEAEKQLALCPHAIATSAFDRSTDGMVPIKKGEAIFFDSIVDGKIHGRTSSGKVGHVPTSVCKVVIAL